jgi:hypothetical protein
VEQVPGTGGLILDAFAAAPGRRPDQLDRLACGDQLRLQEVVKIRSDRGPLGHARRHSVRPDHHHDVDAVADMKVADLLGADLDRPVDALDVRARVLDGPQALLGQSALATCRKLQRRQESK